MLLMSEQIISQNFKKNDGIDAVASRTYQVDGVKLKEDLVVTLEEKAVSLSIRYNQHEAGSLVLDHQSIQKLIEWLKENGVVT
jgi:hypothetical protein